MTTSKIPLSLYICGAIALWLIFTLFLVAVDFAPLWLSNETRSMLLNSSKTSFERLGQFGDSFGAFNAFISILAFAGLISTLRLQQNQVAVQTEIASSNDQLIRQEQFQEQYYRAIDAYRDLLKDITIFADEEGGTERKGRLALEYLWRTMRMQIASDTTPEIREALSLQLASNAVRVIPVEAQNSLIEKYVLIVNRFSQDPAFRSHISADIGQAWAYIYRKNRFQLDALFRAWYTAYRVLATAGSYNLEYNVIRLYSAMFRAQLSWIEMAFLLANQSGLPGCELYPKACKFSNQRVMFDNLDYSNDLIIALLREKALLNSDSKTEGELRSSAFQ